MILKVLFPKLEQPIEVPTGEELHSRMERKEPGGAPSDEVVQSVDMHQTIMDAVDSADTGTPRREPPIGDGEVDTGPTPMPPIARPSGTPRQAH